MSPPFLPSANSKAPELRDYQRDIIEQVHRLDHPLIPLATGGGKTVIELPALTKP